MPAACPSALRRAARLAAVSIPCLLFAACGGGGGGGGTGPVVGPIPLAVTAANEKAVSADALDTATDANVALLGAQLATLVADAGLATGGATVPCSNGGTITISGQLASAGRILPGDVLSMTADNCGETVEGVLGTTNGSLAVTVTDGSYAGPAGGYPAHVVLSVTATGLSVATPGQTVVSNGMQMVDFTVTGFSSGSMVLTGDAMSNAVTTARGVHTSALKNFRATVAINGSSVSIGVDARVETTNPQLGLSEVYYTINTTAPISMNNGTFTGGTLQVGSSGSALQLAVTGPDTFSLQLDANGDRTYELTVPATVQELLALL